MADLTHPALKVLHLTSVESTSTHAAALLASANIGWSPPFMVWAETQTGGRGRRGRSWVSPVGNLFVTLVLPPPLEPLVDQGLLSLKAGVVLATLVQRHYHLRLTLKWPNDLLFAGAKLGGVLLETAVSGVQMGPLSVGIGVNLNHSPTVTGSEYRVIDLRTILGHSLDVPTCVAMLAAEFLPAWEALPTVAVTKAFTAFATCLGDLWLKDDPGQPRRWARFAGIGADGRQRLLSEPAADEVVLSSADHGWRWLYQVHPDAPLFVADVGNTSTKLGWFTAAQDALPEVVEAVPHGASEAAWAAALRTFVALARGHAAPWPLHILSVRPESATHLAGVAREHGFSPLSIPKRSVRYQGAHYVFEDLGADRLAAIEAWLATLKPAQRSGEKRCGIVVATGTATTIDAVATDGTHYGGLILPGITLALRSLHAAASLLPAIDAEAELTLTTAAGALGHDTRSAMLRAVITMTLGAIGRVRAQVRADYGLAMLEDPAGLSITGGWGELLAAVFAAKHRPHLVLQGARVMVLGGLLPSSPDSGS